MQLLAEAGLVRADEVTDFWSQFGQSTAVALAEIGFIEEELEYLTRAVRGGRRGDPDAELVRRVRQAVENCRNEVRCLLAASGEFAA